MAKNIWEETLQRSGAPSVGLGQVTEALSATLKQYLETHQVKNLAELIRSLNPERPAEPPAANPFAGVREVVTTVAEVTNPQRQALAETQRELAEERQRHLDTQLKLVQAAKENRAEEVKAEMSATQAMLTFLQTAMQSNNALLKELVETKIQSATQQAASRQEEPSSLRQFYDKIVSGALEEFFNRRMQQVQAKPSILEQAREFRTLYEEMRQLFPQAGPGEQTDRLRERLELERLGMEERVRLRELELQDAREREREKSRLQFISDLKSIVNDVVSAIQTGRQPAARSAPAVQEVICPSCGERFPHPGTAEFSCPRCGIALTTAEESPKQGSRPESANGRAGGTWRL